MDDSAKSSEPSESVYSVYTEQQALETGGEHEDVATKARLYLAKKKDAIVAEIHAKFADKLSTYETVKGYNDRSLVACQLSSSEEAQPTLQLGSFFNGDGRMASCSLRVNFAAKAAFSYSFCPDTLRCSCCPTDHKIFAGARDEDANKRVAILLCDQGGPPCLASTDSVNRCIPVIRKESGLLLELAEEFLSLTDKVSVMPGSICILTSATQLALGGASEYIRDLVTANSWFGRRFRGEVELVPGPILVLNGSNSTQLHHNALLMMAWCKAAGNPADLLQQTMEAAVTVTGEAQVGGGTPHTAQGLRLPATLTAGGEPRYFSFQHKDDLPVATSCITTAQERRILAKLKSELNMRRGLAIGDLVADRTLNEAAARTADRRSKYLVVGASNSERLAFALEDTGVKVARVTTRNWKAADETVSVVEGHIASGVQTVEPEVVVYELLDNLVFLGRKLDGTTELPKRTADGIYHIPGELIVASKDVQYNLYKVIRPLLMAAGNRPLVIVTPFPRYICKPCCDEPGHVTNFKDAGFADDIIGQLGELRSNFRSFLFADRIRRASTINPAPLMEDTPVMGLWEDPVHPKQEIFAKLAELVVESAERLQGKRKLEEEAQNIRATRGGWSGSSSSSSNREWRGPSSRRGAYFQRGNSGRGRGDYGRGQRGGYRRESY